MAAWRKEERGNETGKVVIAHGSVELCKATPIISLVDEPKNPVQARDGPRPA